MALTKVHKQTGLTINSRYLFAFTADMSQTTGNQYVTVAAGSPIPFGTVYDGDSSLLNTTTFNNAL